jgi:hypothetical protein
MSSAGSDDGRGGLVSAADRIREIGFREVADLLDAGLVHAAWNALRRFKACSIGEAMDLQQARAAMPEDPEGS